MIEPISDYELGAMAMAVKSSPIAMDLLRVMMVAYPNAISARNLMIYIGVNEADPASRFQTFIRLINLVLFINRAIADHGFTIHRTNGTPEGRYWLKRI